MVILHVKRAEDSNQFLYETTTTIGVDALIKELVTLHNLRLKVLRLADACRGLAEFGPLRPEETRGLTDEVAKMSDLDVNAYGAPTHPDPTGFRAGVPPAPEAAAVLKRTAEEAAAAVSHKQALSRVNLELKAVQHQFDCLKGAVMIAYPAMHRLPEWDPAREILEEKEQLEGTTQGREVLSEQDTALWFSGKEMRRDRPLSESVGKNEKTKVIVRMQPRNAGAPVREPRIDEETHKAMLAFYYKKEQEQKKLEEDDEDAYLNSAWADPKNLKAQLLGGPTAGRGVRWKAGGGMN